MLVPPAHQLPIQCSAIHTHVHTNGIGHHEQFGVCVRILCHAARRPGLNLQANV